MSAFEKHDTYEKIVAVIVDGLKVDKDAVTEHVRFEDLGADSLDMVQIVMKLEEQFGMEINDEDAEKMETLSDVVEYVHARRTT